MSDEPEWGPWIKHCGTCCPVRPGQYIAAVLVFARDVLAAKAGEEHHQQGFVTHRLCANPTWFWEKYDCKINGKRVGKVTRYRIRKPRGLAILEEAVKNVDAPKETVE